MIQTNVCRGQRVNHRRITKANKSLDLVNVNRFRFTRDRLLVALRNLALRNGLFGGESRSWKQSRKEYNLYARSEFPHRTRPTLPPCCNNGVPALGDVCDKFTGISPTFPSLKSRFSSPAPFNSIREHAAKAIRPPFLLATRSSAL